jgi:peptide/nickel transport system ATP-binding protein
VNADLRERAKSPESGRSVGAGLTVSDLKVVTSDGAAVVVDEVSFQVESGQVLGLVGESGSGKTTIALALLGHTRRGLRLAGGSVELGGKSILGLSSGELQRARGRDVAYVPQDPASALNPLHRLGSQLLEAIQVHPGSIEDPKARVREVLADVGLSAEPEMLRRFPHQLSGGQQQRVALAMAFACRPGVIVLDEPTTGLDVTVQKLVLDTVRRLCAAYGVAGVYVSHDLAVVSEVASRVAVLYAGRVVEIGETNLIFNSPVHPYTRGLIDSIPSPRRSEVLHGIEGQPPRIGRRPAGCAFEARCGMRVDACRLAPPPPIQIAGRLVSCLRANEIAQTGGARRPEPARTLPSGASRLEVTDLVARYGDKQVLHGVSLSVNAQECVAVVGESGAGKTTLAQCVVGLNRQWTGSVRLDGAELKPDMRARELEHLRRVQYIFQNPYLSLNPRKTIGEIVDEPLRHFFKTSRVDAQAEVLRVLSDVSLGPDYLDRYPDQLSGGERQRVAIARALVVGPEVLVCDEITSALDVSVQAVIIELLRRLQVERKLSLIFITHNLALVRSIAQRCVVLSNGIVVESGSVEQVLERPTHPYTIGLIADMPLLPERTPLPTDQSPS